MKGWIISLLQNLNLMEEIKRIAEETLVKIANIKNDIDGEILTLKQARQDPDFELAVNMLIASYNNIHMKTV